MRKVVGLVQEKQWGAKFVPHTTSFKFSQSSGELEPLFGAWLFVRRNRRQSGTRINAEDLMRVLSVKVEGRRVKTVSKPWTSILILIRTVEAFPSVFFSFLSPVPICLISLSLLSFF